MALILTRRVGEKLIIGTDISITVAGINGNQVRLAVTAPRDVLVDREEIALRRAAERKAAEAGQ